MLQYRIGKFFGVRPSAMMLAAAVPATLGVVLCAPSALAGTLLQ
jgi:hypothetical protein